jgi:hypothetical protein
MRDIAPPATSALEAARLRLRNRPILWLPAQ